MNWLAIEKISRWLARGRDLTNAIVFPKQCAGCRTRLLDSESDCDFCSACREYTVGSTSFCHRCGAPTRVALEGTCPECQHFQFDFDRAFALGWYEGSLKRWVLQIKQGREELAAALGRSLALHMKSSWNGPPPDAIVPLPRHWLSSLFRRGHPEQILAEEVARQWNVPCLPHLLWATRWPKKQSQLSIAKRRTNVRKAFAANPNQSQKLAGRHIVLIDDVLTTGSTASAMAKALRAAGAKSISVAVIARARG
jgi:ComF family protein